MAWCLATPSACVRTLPNPVPLVPRQAATRFGSFLAFRFNLAPIFSKKPADDLREDRDRVMNRSLAGHEILSQSSILALSNAALALSETRTVFFFSILALLAVEIRFQIGGDHIYRRR